VKTIYEVNIFLEFSLTWIKIIENFLKIPGFPRLFVKVPYVPGFLGSV